MTSIEWDLWDLDDCKLYTHDRLDILVAVAEPDEFDWVEVLIFKGDDVITQRVTPDLAEDIVDAYTLIGFHETTIPA